MKNLFKNLMLVAVAAMAFTACQNDSNEVNEVNRVTRYEFTANIADENDDTRSGFVGKNEAGNAYVSEWEGNETLKLFVTDYQGYYVETTATVNTKGEFTLELTDAPESFFMSVCSPAESWASESSYTIPAEQTPLTNSVDPKAHLLYCSPMPVSGGQASIDLTHSAAYGKMTVNGVAFEIDHVVVDLKGSFYGSSRELSYTINADNVENNTFWFATEPIDVAEFTVTAYDAEGNAVAKTVDVAEAGKTMSFAYGRVGTFSVSGLEAPAEPEVPAKVFTSAEVSTAYDLNDYEICFKDQEGKEFYVEFYYENGTYVIDNDILKEGTYVLDEFNGDNGLYYVNYDDIGFSCATVIVSHVEGLYNIQFTNLKKWDKLNGAWTDVPFEEAVYTGGIIGLSNPDGSAPTPEPDPTPDPEEPEEPFADVMATDIKWDSSNSCFSLTAPGFSYIYLEVNSANRPDNKSILVGDYTYGKNENQFRVKYNNGFAFGYSDINNTSTMTVDFVDGQYVILLDVTSLYGGFVGTIGYKGMPEGWVAPSEGGDEPVDPEQPEQPEQPSNELGSESNPYTFTSVAVNGFFLYFDGAENGASLQLDRQKSDVNYMSNYGGPFALNNSTIIYSGSGNVYNVNGTVYQYAQFAPHSTLEVTKANGNWTCKLKMSVDGGATFTYYTYTGQIANQPY